MSYKYKLLIPLFMLAFIHTACKKFLDKKPDKTLNVPTTLNDLQLLLDNYGNMNGAYPYSGEVLADNYYLLPADWTALTNLSLKNYYIWQKDDQFPGDWQNAYRVVFNANLVLDQLEKIQKKPVDAVAAGNIKGAALFYRAFAFYSLAQLFAPPYDSVSAAQNLGIPLRLNSDFNETSQRSSLEQTYSRVFDDLKMAVQLLPVSSAYINRPTKLSAYAALARTSLTMKNYQKAFFYADSVLQINSTLIDYNTLSATAAIPIARFNAEVLFPAVSASALNLNPSRAKVDSVLYASYQSNDLRKTIFFKSNGNNTFSFKGNYDGSNTGAVFSGLTIDEVYLIKAEALARLSQPTQAMAILNALLIKRWKVGTFIPLTAVDATDALSKILVERRKELCFRGLRWTDLRRLNQEPQFALTLKRVLDIQVYMLAPNSNAYTIQIPKQVIDLTAMQQNP